MAAVRPSDATENTSPSFIVPQVIGLGSKITPRNSGTLFLRVNDSMGELSDNVGTLTVVVSRK